MEIDLPTRSLEQLYLMYKMSESSLAHFLSTINFNGELQDIQNVPDRINSKFVTTHQPHVMHKCHSQKLFFSNLKIVLSPYFPLKISTNTQFLPASISPCLPPRTRPYTRINAPRHSRPRSVC
jgi:hypothetical protein